MPAIILLCNLNGGAFTREQETKIKEIVANKQNEESKRLIEAAGNNASNESLLGMTIKVKNKIVLKQTKKQFFKGVKGIFMPFKPANPAYTPN